MKEREPRVETGTLSEGQSHVELIVLTAGISLGLLAISASIQELIQKMLDRIFWLLAGPIP